MQKKKKKLKKLKFLRKAEIESFRNKSLGGWLHAWIMVMTIFYVINHKLQTRLWNIPSTLLWIGL